MLSFGNIPFEAWEEVEVQKKDGAIRLNLAFRLDQRVE